MKSFYSISIPKPCHENWEAMTPNDKGRFCDSCAKTVVDFTKMNTAEIQHILHENRNNRICGHIRQAQLDTINIQIPIESLSNQKNFHRLFLFALLIAMGTTLLNCTNSNDRVQKIDKVEIVDSISNIEKPVFKSSDSILYDSIKKPITPRAVPTLVIPPTGLMIIKKGDSNIVEPIHKIDSASALTIDGEMELYNEDFVLGFIEVSNPPRFLDTPKNLSLTDSRDYFSKKIGDFVQKEFKIETTINLSLSGRQRIFTNFKIDKNGSVKDIKIIAPHPSFEREAIRVLNLLPKFIPAKQKGKNVSVSYSLPIIFQVEEQP